MELSARILGWRRLRNLPQSALAEAAGVTVSAISRIECGHNGPSQAVLSAIVSRLGLDMAKFYGRIPKAPRARAAS
jgi:transcriptional regulator with XRE-family HTH domain